MASATVFLKEGKSYTYVDGPNNIKFTATPVTVTGKPLIDKLKSVSCLSVTEHADKPVVPLAKAAPAGKLLKAMPKAPPAPEPEPEAEPEVEVSADDPEPEPDPEVEAEAEPEVEAEPEPEPPPPVKKGGFKPGNKAKKV